MAKSIQAMHTLLVWLCHSIVDVAAVGNAATFMRRRCHHHHLIIAVVVAIVVDAVVVPPPYGVHRHVPTKLDAI